MSPPIPSFEPDDVALLISAVEEVLQRLYQANEHVGGHDAELLDYGRRYSLILQKLNAIAQRA